VDKPLKSVTHGQCDARNTVTFPAAEHTAYVILSDVGCVIIIRWPTSQRPRRGTWLHYIFHIFVELKNVKQSGKARPSLPRSIDRHTMYPEFIIMLAIYGYSNTPDTRLRNLYKSTCTSHMVLCKVLAPSSSIPQSTQSKTFLYMNLHSNLMQDQETLYHTVCAAFLQRRKKITFLLNFAKASRRIYRTRGLSGLHTGPVL